MIILFYNKLDNYYYYYYLLKESCTPTTCRNNAECENVSDGFICHCADV